MKYSIVIPTYNNKYHLVETLNVLLNQKQYPPSSFEVVVADDGSSDGLFDYVSSFNYPFNLKIVRLERDERSSRSRARNLGWRNASGEYIVFLDSDILVKENHLVQLDRYFDADRECVVLGTRLYIKNDFNPPKINNSYPAAYDFPKDDYDLLDYRYLPFSAFSHNSHMIPDCWIYTYSCNFALPRKWLTEIDGFDENFIEWGMEDVELGYRLHKLGVKIVINPFMETFHQGEGHRDDLAIGRKRIDFYRENIQYFLRKHPESLKNYKDPMQHLISGHNFKAFNLQKADILLEFNDQSDVEIFKRTIADSLSNSAGRVVVFDFCQNSNLDVWIQSMSLPVYYFPVSRMVDVTKMQNFFNEARRKEHGVMPQVSKSTEIESASS